MFFAAAALFAACETDVETPQIYNPENFVAPVIGECGDIIVNADNSDNENVVFSWTTADFGQPVQVLYSVYVTLDGKEGLVGTSNSTSLAISKGDINGVVINSLAASNAFSVQTYAAPLKWMYLCGEFNSWTETTAPIFYETNGGTNTYTCMVDFSASADNTNSFFKVLAEQSWSTSYGKDALTASWTIADNADGNLSMPITEATIHEVTVNMAVMTIDQTAVGNSLGLCGDFNGWGTDDAAFTYDPLTSTWKTAVVALEAGQGVKVRANADWAVNWGATGKNSTVVAGGLELAAGGDNISVPESGNFIVELHANRTPYVLVFNKQ